MSEKLNLCQKLFEIKKRRITLKRDTKAFNYKYATLDQIQEKINPLLEEYNMLVTHYIEDNDLKTQVVNLDNIEEYMTSSIGLGDSIKAQDKGSAITYYRRYNLLSLFDLEVEDDDGAKASQAVDKVPKVAEKQKQQFIFGQEQLEKFKTDRKKHKDTLTTHKKAIEFIKNANYTISDEISNLLKDFYDDNDTANIV